MSTANKLTYLNTTKQNLKTVINTTGAGLTDESTFRSYANVLNDKILGAINGDVDLFEEYPKVSGNGTDLSLNGVVEGKVSITPQGVSSQDGEPTPSAPIPIKVVTGENSIVISNSDNTESQTYPLSLGDMEFCSSPDGTIRDGIIGKPNEWYKREYIGKVVLDGSEGYGKNDSTTGYISFTISNFISKIDKTVSNNLYSNMLKAIASGNVANTCRIATTGRIVVTFNSDFCDYDTSALRTKLQTMYSDNNPLILYIPLVEYTDIPITDTTLISQLNDIYNNAHSYNGVTNITTTYEDGNEQMYLDIEALKNVWDTSL